MAPDSRHTERLMTSFSAEGNSDDRLDLVQRASV
jgi:hypothetical protein